MKQLFFIVFVCFLFAGCKLEDTVVSPNNQNKTGEMLLKFESSTVPSGIVTVTATLTRQGFNPISGNLNIQNDSTAQITFQSIAAGLWHLSVQAKDSSNIVKYSGEADVNVIENSVTQVNLTLIPTGIGIGGIHIIVNWGGPVQNQWSDNQTNPILIPSNSLYDYAGVSQCKILFDNNKFRMYYVGLTSSGIGYILYAESLDGLMWTKPSVAPILSPGDSGLGILEEWDLML